MWDRLAEIRERWEEIDRQLAAISDGRVVPGDPAATEAALLLEQDELEYEVGMIQFECRDRGE